MPLANNDVWSSSFSLLDFEIRKLKLELQTSLIFTLTNY